MIDRSHKAGIHISEKTQLNKKRLKILDRLYELKHPKPVCYNYLDLKGYYVTEAVEKSLDTLSMVEHLLNYGDVSPNTGNSIDHVFTIAAHKGNHSEGGEGKIKFSVMQALNKEEYNFHSDVDHGNFYVRIQK